MMRLSLNPRQATLGNGLRTLLAMLCVLLVLGVVPTFALMMVPERVGAPVRRAFTGSEAQQMFEAKMSETPRKRAAYERGKAKLKAMGLHRTTAAVTFTGHEPVEQSVLRRVSEWIVPSLHAESARLDNEWVYYEDWSGDYGVPDFYGLVDHSWTDNQYYDIFMYMSFNKDPTSGEGGTGFALYDLEVIDYYGFTPPSSPQALASEGSVGHVARAIKEFVYPTLNAETFSRSWWDRLKSYAWCAGGWCAGAATGCFVGNVIDAEILWLPCFAIGCTTAVIGCAATELTH